MAARCQPEELCYIYRVLEVSVKVGWVSMKHGATWCCSATNGVLLVDKMSAAVLHPHGSHSKVTQCAAGPSRPSALALCESDANSKKLYRQMLLPNNSTKGK